MDRNITYKTTELDLIYSFLRGSTLFLYVPDSVAGHHWTINDVRSIRFVEAGLFEIDTERGLLRVEAK